MRRQTKTCIFARSLSQSVARIFFTLILPSVLLSVSLFTCMSVRLSLSVYLSVCLCVSPSIRLSVCLSVRLSLFVSVCLSVCLCVFAFYSSHIALFFYRFIHFLLHFVVISYRHYNFTPLSQVIPWFPKPWTVPRPKIRPALCCYGVEIAKIVTTVW